MQIKNSVYSVAKIKKTKNPRTRINTDKVSFVLSCLRGSEF